MLLNAELAILSLLVSLTAILIHTLPDPAGGAFHDNKCEEWRWFVIFLESVRDEILPKASKLFNLL